MKIFISVSASAIVLAFLVFIFVRYYNPLSEAKFLEPYTNNEPASSGPIKAEYSGWIPEWDEKGAVQSLGFSSSKLQTISPVWYKLDKELDIVEVTSPLKESVLAQATISGVKVVPTIGNEFNGDTTSQFLSDNEIQKKQIDNLVSLAITKNYSGYDIDWEQIKEEDKDLFSAFIGHFAEALHKNRLILTLAIHAQTGDMADWDGSKGHDYKSLAGSADFLRVMAYDYHSGDTAPGPISPTDWLQKVFVYTRKNIPLSKVVIGLPLYGYDWGGDKTVGVTYADVQTLLKKHSSEVKRDEASFEQTFSYEENGHKHTVWFQDAESIKEKVRVAAKYNIHKFCFWRLGGEDYSFWK